MYSEANGLFGMFYHHFKSKEEIFKVANKENMGVSTGIFNTLQFFCSFIGGSLTGLLWGINERISITF
ncbi:hypothetical protein, partial [Clostridioides difficile]|uniref:hypothetical protein n=1 Tax=Clostridioides difficile TaxID=1496 RepID=UPI003F8D1BA4